MPDSDPTQRSYLIVTDHDRGVFSVEGPMTDDRPWESAARYARDHERRVTAAAPSVLSTHSAIPARPPPTSCCMRPGKPVHSRSALCIGLASSHACALGCRSEASRRGLSRVDALVV
jgi:hypothetical protein